MQMVLSKVKSSDVVQGTFNIPKDVTEIADAAFLDCCGLKELVIPDGVTKIGNYAFWHCGDLERIVIPFSVTSFGKLMFKGCVNLKEVIIQHEEVKAVISKDEKSPFLCVKLSKDNSKTIDEGRGGK